MDFILYKINEYLENSLLLDRLSLSMKNEWIGEDGNIFVIFTQKEVEEKLNLLDKTVTKAFNQLKKFKLINEKRRGCKKTNIIYVGKIKHIVKML